MSVSVSGRRFDATTAVACALTAVACAVAYGGLFSHAYPGDTSVYAGYGRALVQDGRIPYRDFYDEYPPGTVPVFVLPALVWNAHYVLVFKLWMTLCAVGFTWCAAWTLHRLGLSPLRLAPVVLAPVLLGPGLPQPLRPAAGAAHLARARRAAAVARPDDRRAARRRDGAEDLSAAVLPVAARRVRSLRGGGTVAFVVAARGADAAVLPARARRGRLQLLDPAPPPPADREPRGVDPPRGLEARRPPRRLDPGEAGIDRPRRPPARRRRRAVVRAGRRARDPRRARLLARPRRRPPARHRVGGCGRRVHGLRQGALAAVPRLARAARPARGRPQGALRRVCRSSARSRSPSPSTCCTDTGCGTRTGRSGCSCCATPCSSRRFCFLYAQLRPGRSDASVRLPA